MSSINSDYTKNKIDFKIFNIFTKKLKNDLRNLQRIPMIVSEMSLFCETLCIHFIIEIL